MQSKYVGNEQWTVLIWFKALFLWKKYSNSCLIVYLSSISTYRDDGWQVNERSSGVDQMQKLCRFIVLNDHSAIKNFELLKQWVIGSRKLLTSYWLAVNITKLFQCVNVLFQCVISISFHWFHCADLHIPKVMFKCCVQNKQIPVHASETMWSSTTDSTAWFETHLYTWLGG